MQKGCYTGARHRAGTKGTFPLLLSTGKHSGGGCYAGGGDRAGTPSDKAPAEKGDCKAHNRAMRRSRTSCPVENRQH